MYQQTRDKIWQRQDDTRWVAQGVVEVICIEGKDLFDVILTDNGTKIEDVYLDNLVSVIDCLVERTDNYQQRVEEEYGLI